ncbi:Rrf2 family transcriptional regulator [Halalkalibacter akibai]|uniref:HTH-type transcriptional regulator NsrR n=1 Tax=Halalkalibacter akibai (strain ATCC 43226 / DSM 21942 / CIP 109018 / JCM 9157 / 1139) TaxID=1236973 RepID=W4QST2_HALA3|nr:Rrf2 family transcriptional regulator [Halalkalibacter akibai]GAE34394.1 nitrite-sensitive transcriptional repressor NsrR [Halalkalibacter akibai JCM 9157]
MHLTTYTDYALRTLVYLGIRKDLPLSKIKDISEVYNISNNHMGKVVYELGQLGLITTIRGKNGGIKLALNPEEINIGTVVRKTENMNIVECFDSKNNTCIISPACKLKFALNEALQAYLAVLDQYTLADVISNGTELLDLFKIHEKQA